MDFLPLVGIVIVLSFISGCITAPPPALTDNTTPVTGDLNPVLPVTTLPDKTGTGIPAVIVSRATGSAPANGSWDVPGDSIIEDKVRQIIGRLDPKANNGGAVKDDLVALGPGAVRYMIAYLESNVSSTYYPVSYYYDPVERAMMATGGPEVFEYYAGRLHADNIEIRLAAIDKLMQLDREAAIVRTLPLLDDPDNRVRAHMVRILNTRDEAAVEPLLNAMDNESLKYPAAIVFALRDDNRGKTAIDRIVRENGIDLDNVTRNYASVYKEKSRGYELWLCLALTHSGNVPLANYLINSDEPVLYYFVSAWVGPHEYVIRPGKRVW